MAVYKPFFDTFKAQLLAGTRTPSIPTGWWRWQVARHGAAQHVDKILAFCGLRTAARAELKKVFGVGTLWSVKKQPSIVLSYRGSWSDALQVVAGTSIRLG